MTEEEKDRVISREIQESKNTLATIESVFREIAREFSDIRNVIAPTSDTNWNDLDVNLSKLYELRAHYRSADQLNKLN